MHLWYNVTHELLPYNMFVNCHVVSVVSVYIRYVREIWRSTST